MPVWPSLDPVQQNDLLTAMTTELIGALPPGWAEVVIDYRHLGRNPDVAVGVRGPDGRDRVWDPPTEVWRMFQRLRGGMYRQDEGTWFSARYTLQAPSRFTIQYNWRNEPDFQPYPDLSHFAIEQERFPRAEAHMPPWFRERLAAATRS
ncbi:hypothetical protein [Labedaea rhizosphaerae]|uniref:Uncharacterized protein n=1 Tax=Labedaea rhizosphaerae TaxID=598644 RepID=A0A4R6S2C4_LABRH|nr:hypothetical protein [Labedaea rhizosphaerae]TDP92796.1 hypothetical protein EV186_10711 [Labedaea rhizosphaerae]